MRTPCGFPPEGVDQIGYGREETPFGTVLALVAGHLGMVVGEWDFVEWWLGFGPWLVLGAGEFVSKVG